MRSKELHLFQKIVEARKEILQCRQLPPVKTLVFQYSAKASFEVDITEIETYAMIKNINLE